MDIITRFFLAIVLLVFYVPYSFAHMQPDSLYVDFSNAKFVFPSNMSAVDRDTVSSLLGELTRRTSVGVSEWSGHGHTSYDQALVLSYDNLDPHAQYKVKVTHVGERFEDTLISLVANDGELVHDYIKKPYSIIPKTLPLPKHVTVSGELLLKWNMEIGKGESWPRLLSRGKCG